MTVVGMALSSLSCSSIFAPLREICVCRARLRRDRRERVMPFEPGMNTPHAIYDTSVVDALTVRDVQRRLLFFVGENRVENFRCAQSDDFPVRRQRQVDISIRGASLRLREFF